MRKAFYDSDGNIVLAGSGCESPPDETARDIHTTVRKAAWTVISEARSPLLEECSKQYSATAATVRVNAKELVTELRRIPSHLRSFLQKVWRIGTTTVPFTGRRAQRKPQTRFTLFMKDTVRFGGTFSFIFFVLFAGINYQSVFQIAQSFFAFGDHATTEEALMNLTDSFDATPSYSTKIQNTSAVNVLTYLPPVGPYADGLIIPSLGLNVPIVRPPMDALVKEDWKKFESDIQESLRDGVVHYPGSAEPGQAGNFFLTGHSSYYPWAKGDFKSVFARLPELNIGDTYFVYYGGDRHSYRITEKYEVKPNNVSVLDQPSNARLSTLMTCTPVGTTLRRLIVRAEEFDPVSGKTLHPGDKNDADLTNVFSRLDSLPI